MLMMAGFSLCRPCEAQSAGDSTIPALMVSDIHFDPFHDPDRAKRLAQVPASQWTAILTPPSTPNEEQAFTALQQRCGARGVDTPYPLLRSSLQAMRSWQPDAKFITVTGDLIAHSFFCRYKAMFPGAAQKDYEDFVVSTIDFVMQELRAAFPGVPVYAELGNNDTDCDDYRLDADSDFLARTGKIIATGLPASDQAQAAKDFAAGGYYNVAMAAPITSTRLIALDDLFLSPKYNTCAGRPDETAANAQMKWLQQQLAEARRQKQTVWVVGHIPPGVDPYSTVAHFKNVCGGESAVMFLSSAKLADLLVEYADVVRLAVFAHTHMDEIRLLSADASAAPGSPEHSVAVKLVASISPVNGNKPSFTIAHVNPSSGLLQDYEVIVASNKTGIAATWAKEYDFTETFHETAFSAAAVKDLDTKFKEDGRGTTPISDAYIHHYFVGDLAPELKPFWSQYVCSVGNYTAKGFADCVCSPGK